jgi:chromosome segregation ATPase
MDPEEFCKQAMPYMKEFITGDVDFAKLASLIQTRIETFLDIRDQADFIEKVPDYDLQMYVNKKNKTNLENSLEILREVLPLLKEQESFANDALFEALKEYAAKKEYKESESKVNQNKKTMDSLKKEISVAKKDIAAAKKDVQAAKKEVNQGKKDLKEQQNIANKQEDLLKAQKAAEEAAVKAQAAEQKAGEAQEVIESHEEIVVPEAPKPVIPAEPTPVPEPAPVIE